MAKRSSIRASDADRDRVTERLHQAVSEGRLMAHEFEERLARTLRARTYGELDDVVEDLPGAPVAMSASRPSSLPLLRRYPVPFAIVACLVGVAVAGLVAAAIAVVASGLWILPVVAFFVFRGKGRHSRRGPGRGHVHARRYGRF
jgi:hypothetical protein